MILNKTRKTSELYRILPGGMGGYGDPPEAVTNRFHIASGTPHNPSGLYSVVYWLTLDYVPQDAKLACRAFLKTQGIELP